MKHKKVCVKRELTKTSQVTLRRGHTHSIKGELNQRPQEEPEARHPLVVYNILINGIEREKNTEEPNTNVIAPTIIEIDKNGETH